MRKGIYGIYISFLFVLMAASCSGNKKIYNKENALKDIRGTYAQPPRLTNKRVDTKQLISQLKDLNANTYNWLIWQHETDWEDLQIFLPQALKNKIRVWVTVVPPSEGKPRTKWDSEPFRQDYVKWGEELAGLSLKYPNLVVYSIDDFAHNLKLFTPQYLSKMRAAMSAINPGLQFVPCIYFRQATPSLAENISSHIDGILFPYMAWSGEKKNNLINSKLVKNEVEKIREVFERKVPVFLDVYLTAHSTAGSSTPQYVREVIIESEKYADGTLIYTHPNPQTNAAKYKIVKDEFGK